MNSITALKNNSNRNSLPQPISNILPKPINSFVNGAANIVNNVMNNTSNAVSNATNAVTNSIGNTSNALKNIASPISNSINAIPNSGPSSGLMFMILLGLIILGLVIAFYNQITDAIKKVWGFMKGGVSTTEKGIEDIAKDASQGLKQAASDIGSVVPGVGGLESDVNKFLPQRKQVFNVSENKYTYGEAEPLCRALGAELATYEQVKEAWNQGADWCNYGWVKGQGAVYPTQNDTWEKLQRSGSDDERMQCGNVGVNGGYFSNPDLRFGVNCYGEKPPEKDHDLKVQLQGMDKPLSPEGLALKKKELKFRSEKAQIGVLPFKDGKWAE